MELERKTSIEVNRKMKEDGKKWIYSHCSALDDLTNLVEVLSKLFHRRAQHLDFLVRPFSTEDRRNLMLDASHTCVDRMLFLYRTRSMCIKFSVSLICV